MTPYQQRVNAENLANQALDVQRIAKEILEGIEGIERCLYWAIEPEERDAGDHWSSMLIEHAHALLDLGHAYRAELKANPPPKEEDDAA